MKRPTIIFLCQVYVLLLLLATTIISAPPYSVFSFALLALMIFVFLRPLQPRFNVALYTAITFLVPLMAASTISHLASLSLTAIQVVSTTSALPVIYLLDYQLRRNAPNIKASAGYKNTRQTTIIYRALFSALIALLVTSIVLNAPILFAISITFALYLFGVLIAIFITIHRRPVEIPVTWRRVIAGTSINISLDIVSSARMPLHCLINPVNAWVKVMPQDFTLHKGKARFTLNCAPPLSGPSHLKLRVTVIDPRGFIQINHMYDPVELHVIPRAKYAEWLATKYLEQIGSGASSSTLPPREMMMLRRGTEYQGSRSYQPGDPLKDVDWKHTLKLSNMIIKEFVEAGEQAAVIVVNLSVSGAEEADELAFNLITAAMTLAREHIPTALAAYNHESVILTTTISNPRDILKRTLSLVKDIATVKFSHQYLKAVDIAKLRRNIAHLKQVKTEPAQRLYDLLKFEHRAVEGAAQNHPATTALRLVTAKVQAPAVILLISQLNHDAEAVLVNIERLSKRQFTTISL